MSAATASLLWVVDSDVLIDYLRDQPQAVAFLEGSEQPLAMLVITVAELYAGVRDGEERQQLDAFIGAFTVLPLDRQPAQRAGLWRRQHGPSHGTGLADALIAATFRCWRMFWCPTPKADSRTQCCSALKARRLQETLPPASCKRASAPTISRRF
jgi:predicted nucleic acid-binding protein